MNFDKSSEHIQPFQLHPKGKLLYQSVHDLSVIVAPVYSAGIY